MANQRRKRNGQFDKSAGLVAGKSGPRPVPSNPLNSSRREPAYPVKVMSEGNTTMIVGHSGRVYWKMYDEYGAGAGTKEIGPIGRFIHRKKIREAIDSSYESNA